jgi:hypothetical protein
VLVGVTITRQQVHRIVAVEVCDHGCSTEASVTRELHPVNPFVPHFETISAVGIDRRRGACVWAAFERGVEEAASVAAPLPGRVRAGRAAASRAAALVKLA